MRKGRLVEQVGVELAGRVWLEQIQDGVVDFAVGLADLGMVAVLDVFPLQKSLEAFRSDVLC